MQGIQGLQGLQGYQGLQTIPLNQQAYMPQIQGI